MRLHGASYVTYDLDICISLAPQNLYRLETAVEDLHPFHRLAANKLPLELTEELCTRLKNLYLQTDLGVLDCLGEIAGVGDYNKVAERSVVFSFPFGGCRVLSLDALIEAKETIGREKDPRALRFSVRHSRQAQIRRERRFTQISQFLMSILVNSESKVLVQGITGSFGARHTQLSLDYGTRVVAGVTPGKGGQQLRARGEKSPDI